MGPTLKLKGVGGGNINPKTRGWDKHKPYKVSGVLTETLKRVVGPTFNPK